MTKGSLTLAGSDEFEPHNVEVAAGMNDGINMPQKALLKELVCLIQDEELYRG